MKNDYNSKILKHERPKWNFWNIEDQNKIKNKKKELKYQFY